MSNVKGVGSHHSSQAYDRRCADGRGDLTVHGNTVDTGRFKIEASKDAIKVFDEKTGKWTKVWGDPHLETSDGDKTDFHNRPVTLNLPDGTKITLEPTKTGNEKEYLARAVITKEGRGEDDAVVVNYDHDRNPTMRVLDGRGDQVDRRTPDHLDLFPKNGSIDDWTVEGRPWQEIEGDDIANLDNLRTRPDFGRPHIGLPGRGRHDGPCEPWGFARHDRDCHEPHHRDHDDHHHHGPRGAEIRDLRAQLRYYLQRASDGPWFARAAARDRIDQIEQRLSELT